MPLLNSCGPFSAAVGPSLTLVNSGSILQASASYAGSSVMKKFKKGFTIIELLVVLAVIGVFSAFAYPNISSWIEDRNIKKEISELVSSIKEIKSEVSSGKYGMVQLQLFSNVEVYTMSLEHFLQTYKNVQSSNTSYKINKQCGSGSSQPNLVRNSSKEKISFGR